MATIDEIKFEDGYRFYADTNRAIALARESAAYWNGAADSIKATGQALPLSDQDKGEIKEISAVAQKKRRNLEPKHKKSARK